MNRMNRLFHASYSPEGPEEALTTTIFAPPVTEMPSPKNHPLKAG
jgi:HSP20 family protein